MSEQPKTTPGEAIKAELSRLGWTHDDLARIMGKYRPEITTIISGKRNITPELAIELAAAIPGTTAEYWLDLEASRQLSLLPHDPADIKHRLRMYQLGPIREMENRGWIKQSENASVIESELKTFFEIVSIDEEPRIGAATRKSDIGEPLTHSQRAWCFRVRQLAKAQIVAEYREEFLPQCIQELRKLAAYPQEIYKVPSVLAKYGIRFAIVAPLQSSKVDGVAMWLDQKSPVIGMSLRHDRMDSFWFTLCHEIAHLKHQDEAPLDSAIVDQMDSMMVVKDEMERRADDEAASMLIPKDEMDSFVLRVGPLYAKDRIIRFAHRVKIHPAIIVGQLQHRKEIGYSANREMLAKIRHVLAPAAIVDGWGYSIDPRSFQ
ncbi:MAG TPA: helix-turn-helix domain-containing protein [Phycisphaerae bacterium]|nr:helix-turn-helix domain-containing protein [Phycisphaerae bacterium]